MIVSRETVEPRKVDSRASNGPMSASNEDRFFDVHLLNR